MGVPVLCTVKTAWLPAAASRRVTAPLVPAYLMALSSRITANRCREAASPCTVWPGFVRYNQDIHRQISFGFLQFIDTVYHNQLKIG
jgi:hypothetical protein